MKKTICIIGAGISGITSCKSAIEVGLQPTVFETSGGFGGNWNPTFGKSWPSVTTNISKYSCMFSDFPYQREEMKHIDFPSREQVHQYLSDYIKEFNLIHSFRFQCKVIKARFDNITNKWSIQYIQQDTIHTQIFDFLIVSSGIFSKGLPFNRIMTDIDSVGNKFKGKLIHSQEYRSPEPYTNQRVLVVGNGNSGCEIVHDLLKVNCKVYHFSKRDAWIVPRLIPVDESKENGAHLPIDLVLYNREKQSKSLQLKTEERHQRTNNYFDKICKEQQSIESVHVKTDFKHPISITINNGYLDDLKHDRIQITKDPKELLNSNQVDTVIFCHGFQTDLSFLSEYILNRIQFKSDDIQTCILYKECFPNPSEIRNLAFVGLFRGTFFGSVELMGRWACMVFAGLVNLPSEQVIEEGIKGEIAIRNRKYVEIFPHADFVNFSDSIAKEINVLPDFKDLEINDPYLYSCLWNKPHNVSSYRLTGPFQKKEKALEFLKEFYKEIESRSIPIEILK